MSNSNNLDCISPLYSQRYGHFIPENCFKILLSIECKRTDRSGKPFMVMLLDLSQLIKPDYFTKSKSSKLLLYKISKSLIDATRGIDIKGWYRDGKVIGILFTEISADGQKNVVEKVTNALYSYFTTDDVAKFRISCYWYPFNYLKQSAMFNIFFPDNNQPSLKPKLSEISKRAIDILGSITGLLLFSPVFFFAFIFIPLTSKGPVFFKQNRVGKGGQIFKILKLRTMFLSNDESLHRNYVTNFIRGESVGFINNSGKEIYKLTCDSRITSIGKFLRKASLDEIPQFINVLLGDMSLVGPRPPIPYEVSEYHHWHCNRLQCKPGITGYWQTEGRSRTNFDNMVRMDINYIKRKSILLDLKVIFKTPFVLISSKGAY